VKCFLHWLDMPFAVGIDIKDNNYKCDCMDYDVISTVRRSYALNRIYCNRTTPFDRTILQQRVGLSVVVFYISFYSCCRLRATVILLDIILICKLCLRHDVLSG